MDIQVMTQLISGVGFPIFVAIYFMEKTSKDNQRITDALNSLTGAITNMQSLLNILVSKEGVNDGK